MHSLVALKIIFASKFESYMNNLFKILEDRNIELPSNIVHLLESCKGYTVFNSTDDLMDAATTSKEDVEFDVSYSNFSGWPVVARAAFQPMPFTSMVFFLLASSSMGT